MRKHMPKVYSLVVAGVIAIGAFAALMPSTALACSCRTWCPPCFLYGLECVCGGTCGCCTCAVSS